MASKSWNGDTDTDALRSEIDRIFIATRDTRQEMLRHRKLFEGKLWNLDEPEFDSWDKSQVQFNILFSTIQQILPLLSDNRPIARVIPRWPFMSRLSEVLNNVLKYAWDALEMRRKIHEYTLDGMTAKFGVAKMWCDPERGHIFEIIDPIDFFIAPGYDDPWEAPFCGVRALKPVSWVREMFPDVKNIKTGKAKDDLGDEEARAFKYSGANQNEASEGWVQVTEVWCKDGALEDIRDENGKPVKEEGRRKQQKKYPYGKLKWFTPHQDLGEMASPDRHGKAPYVLFKNYIRPHDVTGISEIENIEGLHKDINLMLKTYSDYIRKYHNQNELADTTGGFDVENYKANRTKGGQVFAYDSRNNSLKPPVTTITDPQPNAVMGELIRAFIGLVEETTAVTDVAKGQVGKTERQSAVELGVLSDAVGIRPRQRERNLEWSLERITWLFLNNVMQYQSEPEHFPYREQNGVGYEMYGNSKAQAMEIMEPKKPQRVAVLEAWSEESGIPVGLLSDEDRQAMQEYQREVKDFEMFLAKFEGTGEFDPVYFPFSVQIDSDSMLPMDQQSRANILLRLLQMAPAPAKAKMFELVLEHLQVKNADEVIEVMNQAMQQVMQGSKAQAVKQKMSSEDVQAAQRDPQAFQKYLQEVGSE